MGCSISGRTGTDTIAFGRASGFLTVVAFVARRGRNMMALTEMRPHRAAQTGKIR